MSKSAKPRKITQLEELARDMVGDGKSPNLYFVTKHGVVVTVTTNLMIAYRQWQELRLSGGFATLEDRQHGVLASYDLDDELCRMVCTCDIPSKVLSRL